VSRLLRRVCIELTFACVIAVTLLLVERFALRPPAPHLSQAAKQIELAPHPAVVQPAEPVAVGAETVHSTESDPGYAARPAATVPSFSVKFTTNQHGGPESTCHRPLCRQLLGEIEAARKSIDFAVYGVRGQPAIVAALVAARRRGVTVRGVVDAHDTACTKFEYTDTGAVFSALGAERVKCDSGPSASDIMHNKFFVFDRETVWTGSTNISDTELGGEYNSDVAVTLRSKQLAAVYLTEFEEMYSGAFHRRKANNTRHLVQMDTENGPMRIESYFSPTDRAIASAVLPLIRNAKRTLDIAMFFFTSREVAAALVEAHRRGVSIRMILDAGGASNRYSQHHTLCEHGVEVKVENWGGKSHSKWAVADAGERTAAVVFGSMNWTEAGDRNNDENTVYVHSSEFAAPFRVEFEREWKDLAAVPACVMVGAEGAESSRCTAGDCTRGCRSGSCCDMIDNDYDGKVDASEEACGCHDGLDNDGDGFIDANDFDCRNQSQP
jgi:phosphatidylserine/phosphatidylglycerophosphate/cardiolipin synthase-like enzyme